MSNVPSVSPAKDRALNPHSDESFRRLVEDVRDYAIFMLNPEGRIVSWNAGAQRIKGYTADEAIGQHFSIFYTADALESGWPDEELRQARQFGRFEDEGWRLRKDGSRFWANVIIAPLRGSAGELLGFSKITRDLTERRRHEQSLKESEESFRLLVEGVSDHAIFLLDAAGDVRSWNAGAQRVLGFRADEVLGRSAWIFYPEGSAAAGILQKQLAIAREAGFSEVIDWRVKSDGTKLWADVTLTTINERDGSLRGFVHVIRDLTERRRVHQLESEGQRISEFIAMLSHELRNPLTPIANAVSILKKVGETPQVERYAGLIERQVTHLSRLVEDLLDVSRITSGKIQLREETLDLNMLVRATVDSVRSVVEGYGHALELRLAPEPFIVNGDPTRLTQVMTNLLTNAAKYTPQGGHVSVELELLGSVAELHVTDDGIGMSAALMENAFDPFMQGNRDLDRSEGGLGIGLTLVKSIVTLHGGTVTVKSTPGRGSRFSVTLPRWTPQASLTEPSSSPATAAPGARRILVVDDNEDAAGTLAMLLEMSGHEVFVAHDGPEALGIAVSHPLDVVLLDLGLPAMDGYEVARRLRKISGLESTRLIALTGYGQESARRAAIEAGFEAHLVKPVDFEELAHIIQGHG